jgi:hypothetical protein
MSPDPIEYLDPDQAVAAITRATPKRWRKGNHRYVDDPVPVRRPVGRPVDGARVEQAGPDSGPAPRDGRRPGSSSGTPATLSPEELAQVQERSRAGLLLTADEVQAHKRYGHDHPVQAHVPGRR